MTDTQADLTERARQLRDEVLFAVKDGISINALNKLFDSLTAALQSEREATEAAIDMDTHCRTLGCLADTLRQERHAAQEKAEAAAAEARRAAIEECARAISGSSLHPPYTPEGTRNADLQRIRALASPPAPQEETR
jgi:hypothetical protein